jgi:peptide/nickel transport system ATP-binding protein
MSDLLLEVNNLHTHFQLEEGLLKAVNGVSFSIHKNRTLGIVGESGCGKSVTAQSIMQIVPPPGRVQGEMLLHQDNGTIIDLAKLSPSGREIRDIRGRDIAMIFQEPMTAFSPVHTIGAQIMEAILIHQDVNKSDARRRVIDLLRLVGISIPDRRIDAAACHDCDVPGTQATAPHRRRANDRAGCNYSGANPAAHQKPAKRDRDGGHVHHT